MKNIFYHATSFILFIVLNTGISNKLAHVLQKSRRSQSIHILQAQKSKFSSSPPKRNPSKPNNGTSKPTGLGASINLEINNFFLNPAITRKSLSPLRNYLESKKDELLHVHAISLMQRCSKSKVPIESVISLSLLNEALQKHTPYKYKSFQVSNSLYGLRSLFLQSQELTTEKRLIIRRVIDILTNCDEISYSGQEIGNSFYGLQFLPSHYDETKLLLKLIVEKMQNSVPNFNAQEIGTSLYGLRKMSSEDTEVINALDMLLNHIVISTISELNEQSLGLAINGLQNCNTDKTVVRQILSVLTQYMKASQYTSFQSTTLVSIFYGIRKMSHICPELTEFIDVLADKLMAAKCNISNETVAQILGNLRNLNDNIPSVKKLLTAITMKIQENDFILKPDRLSHCFAGFKSMHGTSDEFQSLIHTLQYKIINSTNATDVIITSNDVGRIFYGLQNMNFPENYDIVTILQKANTWIKKTDFYLYNRDVGLTLYGFKSVHIKNKNNTTFVSEILSTLATKIDINPTLKKGNKTLFQLEEGQLNSQTASMAFLGLQTMSSEQSEINTILDALHDRIVELDTQAVGNILYSMRYMSSDSPSVRRILGRLAPLMKNLPVCIPTQEFANALWGLQGMDSKYIEVINIIQILCHKLKEIPMTDLFSAQEVSMAISGLQSMSADDSPYVAQLAGLLADRLEACPDNFKPMEIANILFGLQGMAGHHEEVRAILVALLPKMKESTGTFTSRDIGFSMIGLSTMQKSKLTYEEIFLTQEELNVKIAGSDLKGQPELVIETFGRGIKVKKGN